MTLPFTAVEAKAIIRLVNSGMSLQNAVSAVVVRGESRKSKVLRRPLREHPASMNR